MRLRTLFAILLIGVLSAPAFARTFDQATLDKILRRARETNSSAVLILQNGKPIGEYFAGAKDEKIELMSCTKSIVSLAVGRLIEQGRLKSIDQPVFEFYPEWKQGRKASVTIKHLLNHTSGLQNVVNAGAEIYPAKDFVKLALAAELADAPGTRFSYNNKAVNLLAGIIAIASGKRMDQYIRDELFAPLGIKDFGWSLDGAGNPHVMAGLQLSAADFAKLGQLVLNGGKWNGSRIISEKWIADSLAQAQPFNETGGLLWWRMSKDETFTIDDEHFQKLETAGFAGDFLAKLKPLKGKIYRAGEQYAPVVEIFGKDWQTIVSREMANKNMQIFKRTLGKIDAYNANGYLGQFLVIFPEKNIVAVRQVKQGKNYRGETDGFNDFMPLVMQLAK